MNTTVDILANQDTVLLATAVMEIQDCRGNLQHIREVIDRPCEANVISENTFYQSSIF